MVPVQTGYVRYCAGNLMTGLILRLCCWFIDCKILCVEFPGLMHVMGGEVERGFDEPVAESLIGVHVPSAGQPLPPRRLASCIFWYHLPFPR